MQENMAIFSAPARAAPSGSKKAVTAREQNARVKRKTVQQRTNMPRRPLRSAVVVSARDSPTTQPQVKKVARPRATKPKEGQAAHGEARSAARREEIWSCAARSSRPSPFLRLPTRMKTRHGRDSRQRQPTPHAARRHVARVPIAVRRRVTRTTPAARHAASPAREGAECRCCGGRSL